MAEDAMFGSMISAGLGMASGNPLAIAGGIAGLGLSIFGGMEQSSAAAEKAAAQQRISGLETQQDEIRRKAMRLSASRQNTEVLRNAQRGRSLALNTAVNQGAQLGSGLQGGYAQIQGAANWNIAGIQQNLGFGEQMFDTNALINQQKQAIAATESRSASGAGLSKIGGTLMSSFGPIKNLSQNFLGPKETGNTTDYGSGGGSSP